MFAIRTRYSMTRLCRYLSNNTHLLTSPPRRRGGQSAPKHVVVLGILHIRHYNKAPQTMKWKLPSIYALRATLSGNIVDPKGRFAEAIVSCHRSGFEPPAAP
jgi:hypothetical protein